MRPGWKHADAPRLWRFHLHYWDWAWGLAADPDRLAARARLRPAVAILAGVGRVRPCRCLASLPRRAAGLVLVRSAPRAWWPASDIEPDFVAGLAAHAGFLRHHLEYDSAATT